MILRTPTEISLKNPLYEVSFFRFLALCVTIFLATLSPKTTLTDLCVGLRWER